MYKIEETKKIEEATYEYNVWCSIRDAETWGDDVSLPNNTVVAISGETLNAKIANEEIDLDELSVTDPFISTVFYVFRRTLRGKLLPLHVSMRPKTAANIARGSERYGSAAIDREVFGKE